MFENRRDAGRKLARALEEYRGRNALVLAIPRGGVEVAYEVASYLDADFSVLVARKLPYPYEPEAGFGAIAEDGSTYISDAADYIPPEVVRSIIEEQKQEIERRISVLRRGRSLPEIRGRTVILVDDGLAMGSTMRTAIMLCRKRGAGRVIVAVPVAGEEVAAVMRGLADDVVVLEIPPFFQAVAQVYRNWYDVTDSEAVGIIERWERIHKS